MAKRTIQVTRADLRRLNDFVRSAIAACEEPPEHLTALQSDLSRAIVVGAQEGAVNDVVAMNAQLRIRDCASGTEVCCCVVFPSSVDLSECRFSVLTPLGAELLGRRVGERVSFPSTTGPRVCEIVGLGWCRDQALESGVAVALSHEGPELPANHLTDKTVPIDGPIPNLPGEELDSD